MKKSKKIFLFGIMVFLLSMCTVNAKQLTINELGDSLEDDVDSAYVIGNYIFTSKNGGLRVEDIMLAARSISLDGIDETDMNAVREKMYIARIEREYNDETDEPTGNWIVDDNLVGDYKLPSNIEVDHVDGEIVKEDSNFSISLDTSKYQNQLRELSFSDNKDFSENLKIEKNNKLSGLILKKDLDGNAFTGEDKTGYYFAFTLKVPKAKTETTVTLKGKRTYKITKADFDGEDEVVVLWALDKDATNKTITIIVDVDGNGQQYLEKSIVIDYSELEFQEDSELEIYLPEETSYQLNNLNLTGSVYQTVEDKKYYVDLKLSASKAVNGKATVNVNGTSELRPGDFSNFTLKHELTENCQGENCKLEVTIDNDGSEHKYLPKTYTIKYPTINYVENYEVTFKYPNQEIKQNVYADAKIKKPEDPTVNEYHKFLGWASSNNQRENVEIEKYEVKGDVTFVPHWELISIDDFISSKIEENNKLEKIHEKINFIEKNGSIEADVLAPKIPTSAINETIIPDTIYELLAKDEITGIDIQIGGSETTITSNNVTLESVKSEISDLLADDRLANATLDDIVSKEENLTISVASVADNIEELSDSYTIDFVSDFRIVDNLTSLKNSLDNIDVDMIYINNDITVENKDGSNVSFTIDTERNVTLKSLNNKDIKTISLVDQNLEDTFDPDKEPVITVTKGNITIEDLKIKGGSTAIRVGDGTNVANVTLSNVTAVDSINSAFDVNANASLTVPKGSSVYYKKTVDGTLKDKESYYTPTICGNGKVDIDGITAVSNYERIVRSNDNTWSEDDFKDPETHKYYPDFVDDKGNLKQDYKDLEGKNTSNHTEYISKTNHTHYYLDKDNSKYYKIHFWDSRVRLIIYKYFAKGDEIVAPVDNTYTTAETENGLHFFIKAYVKDDKTYVHDGWTNLSTGINGTQVELELPKSNEDPVSYYSRFVEGYRIRVYYTEGENQKVAVFGIVKPTSGEQVKISELMNEDSEYYDSDFKEAWDKIKAEAQSAQNTGKNIYDTVGTISEIVDENSVINGNIDLKVTEPTKANIALASNSQDYNLSNNSLNGKLYANKFAINVNIPEVEANKSTITVTNPNNEVNTIKATSENTQIELAAITSSMLNKNANKVYKIAVDADGEEGNFGPTIYSLDYSTLTLAEEIINYAATNTLNAESLAYKNRGHFKGEDRLIDVVYQKGNYNTQYYKEYSKSGDNLNPKYEVYYYNPEGHTFVEYAKYKKLSRHEKTLAYTVALSKDCENELQSDSITHKTEDGYYLNGFRYVNNDYHGMGLTELKLLVDVTDDSRIEALNSVERVKKEDGYDLYKVSVSSDRINEWLDNNYDAYNNSGTSVTDGDYLIEDAITLMVEVSDSGYITKIYTQSGDEFSYRRATKTDKEADYYRYNDNKFDITISDINETVVPDIYTVLNIQEQTDEEGNVVKNKENIVKEFLKSAGYNRNLEQ